MRQSIKTTVIIMVAILASCGQPKPETKTTPSKAQSVMALKIKVDKSHPQIMYINTNNVRVYDLDQSLMLSGVVSPIIKDFRSGLYQERTLA